MSRLLRKIFACLVLLITVHCQGQSYYFKHYQADDGLAHNTVITITQDSKGLLWFGTKGGLNRFDGYTFKTYKNIGNNVISSIAEDQDRMIWVGTERGLFKYNTVKETFTEVPALSSSSISYIQIGPSGDLWFLAGSELSHYEPKKDRLTRTGQFASCLTADSSNHLWLGHDDGSISVMNGPTIQVIDRTLRPQLKLISKIYPAENGLILIGTTREGLKSYDPKTGNIRSLLLRNKDNTEIFVRDIVQSGPGEYWIATESGIYIYNTHTDSSKNLRKRAGDDYSLTDNAIYSLCRDNQGGLWAGTFFGGLNYFSSENARFKKYYPLQNANSIQGNAIREICSDKDNNIWIGTEDAGINKLDTRTGKFTNYTTDGTASGLSYPNIHGLLAVGNRLYVGPFQHGLEIMDLKTGRIIDRFKLIGERDTMNADFIMCIHQTRDSNILIGTTGIGAGLYNYDASHHRFTRCRQIPWGSFVYDILEDHNGTIYTGSLERGSFYFNRRTGEKGNIRFAEKGERDHKVQGIFEDSDHSIWFATEGGGLIRLDSTRKQIKKFTTENGLPSNNLFRILEDDHKNIWISSLKGLACLNLKTEQVKVYTQSNGLITDQFNYNSAFKDHSGEMYFGSVKGMIAFDPDRFTQSPYTPATYITGFAVNNTEVVPDTLSSPLKKSILYTDSIRLDHNQSSFSIEFAALNYSSPAVTRYKYFMKGLDKDWTYLSSNRKAYFTDLSPGSYTFIVRAESNVGSWTGKETRLFIKIRPPFWKSAWAWVIYIHTIGLILWLCIRSYHRSTERKNRRKLERFEYEKEKEIYQSKIEFFTNIAHEIQTPLTLILGPLERLIKKIDETPSIRKPLLMMDKSGKRLLELTTQLLDFRKTEADQFGLSFVNADITNILHEQIAVFKPEADKAGITIHTDFPQNHLIAYVDIEAFIKIITNLLSNAIKYSSSSASIKITTSPETFSIQFANDGKAIPEEFRQKIFEPFFRLRSTEKPGTGIGLSLAKSLTELHNGTLTLISGDTNNIIFNLSLPIHQKFEFKLSKWKKIPS
ncbi:MAG: histidine kinase [Bacteroidetes bacterium]|nr:histidine kinase [Bacteroidota bacterium]